MPDPILMAEAFAAAFAIGMALALVFGVSSRTSVVKAGTVLGVVGAIAPGVWILGLLPHYPPREDLDRLLLVLLPAAAIAELIAAASGRIGWVARAIVAALAAPVLLHGSVYVADLSGPGSREWSVSETWLIFSALGMVSIAGWVAMNRLAVRTGDRTAMGCVAGASLGAGIVIMLSGYATGGQLGVPLAGGLGGIVLVSLTRKKTHGIEAALGVGFVGLFSLLVVGRLFAGLTTLNAALLFSAPLLGWLPEVSKERPRLRAALRLTLAAAPVVVAIVLAKDKFAADSTTPSSATEGTLDDYMNYGK